MIREETWDKGTPGWFRGEFDEIGNLIRGGPYTHGNGRPPRRPDRDPDRSYRGPKGAWVEEWDEPVRERPVRRASQTLRDANWEEHLSVAESLGVDPGPRPRDNEDGSTLRVCCDHFRENFAAAVGTCWCGNHESCHESCH